jgi:alpha-glucosidase (family GH31 glycosyl hydrolase)
MTEDLYIKPLAFEPSIQQNIENQFLVGNILVCPPLEEIIKTFKCVFPTSIWCNIFTFECLNIIDPETKYIKFEAEHIPAFYRGGGIYLAQKPEMIISEVSFCLIRQHLSLFLMQRQNLKKTLLFKGIPAPNLTYSR